jgi:hypothetical protein
MPLLVNVALCGILGAILAHVAYTQSNLFLMSDPIRRGRHPLWDPAFFDAMGVLWGVVVAIVAARLIDASAGKSLVAGLGMTLVGIAAFAGATTFKRYAALPHEPKLEGATVMLEFELRLPGDRSATGPLPARGDMDGGGRSRAAVTMSTQAMRTDNGRIVIPGSVPIREAASPRLLAFDDRDGLFVNFMLPLAERPTDADVNWTDWMRQVNADAALPASGVFELRYRVRFTAGR